MALALPALQTPAPSAQGRLLLLPLKVRPKELWPRPGLSVAAAREGLKELPPWSLEDEPEVSRQGRGERLASAQGESAKRVGHS